MSEDVRAAAERLLNEVALHAHEYGHHDYESPDHHDLADDIETVARFILSDAAEARAQAAEAEVGRLQTVCEQFYRSVWSSADELPHTVGWPNSHRHPGEDLYRVANRLRLAVTGSLIGDWHSSLSATREPAAERDEGEG